MEQSWPLARDIGKIMLQYWNDGNSLFLQNAIHGRERRWELASSILSEILHLSKRTWLENGAWRWWYQWYPIYSYLQMLVFQPCLPHDKPGLIRSLPPIEPCAQVRRVVFSDPFWNMGGMWNQRIKRIHSQWNRQSLGFWKKKCKTSQITLKLEGISVEDMTDGDSMLMK